MVSRMLASASDMPSDQDIHARRLSVGQARSCAPCDYADRHGWWGPDHKGTHCRDCHGAGRARRGHIALSVMRPSQATRSPTCITVMVRTGAPGTVEGLYLGSDGIWSTSADRDPERGRQRAAFARSMRHKASGTSTGQAETPATVGEGQTVPDGPSKPPELEEKMVAATRVAFSDRTTSRPL